MKSIRMLVIGLMVGALLATSATAFAGPVLKKVSAVLRPDYTIKVDGNKTELKNDPISYNGTTYVPLRELGEMFGRDVGFDSSTSTVTLDQKTEDVGDVSMPTETVATEWVSLRQLSQDHGISVSLPSTNDKKLVVKYQQKQISFQLPSSIDQDTTVQNDNGNQLLVRKDSSLYLSQKDVDDLLGQ